MRRKRTSRRFLLRTCGLRLLQLGQILQYFSSCFVFPLLELAQQVRELAHLALQRFVAGPHELRLVAQTSRTAQEEQSGY